jgi:hypothetical protein
MDNLSIYNKYREVPKEAKKEIKGGRMNGKTDINPMWRIKCLTEQYGPCGEGWYYKPVKKWLEAHGDEVAAFVDIELFVRVGGEWSMPISGTGGSMFAAKEKSGIYVSDECFKMATTDAISVVCKQLGFGANTYWQSNRSKYDKPKQNDAQDYSKKTITTKEAKALTALVKRKGLDMAKVFTVPVEELTPEQYVTALKQLEKLKDK